MAKGGCSKEQPPFLTNEAEKGRGATEMAPTKSNDRILPITEEALPYFLRQFDLIARQKALTEAGGGVYYDNKLFIAKPDGSPQRRDRMSANFGQLIRHLEMPHIRFHDLRHPYVKPTTKKFASFLKFFRAAAIAARSCSIRYSWLMLPFQISPFLKSPA